jgi:hypothetical protein
MEVALQVVTKVAQIRIPANRYSGGVQSAIRSGWVLICYSDFVIGSPAARIEIRSPDLKSALGRISSKIPKVFYATVLPYHGLRS